MTVHRWISADGDFGAAGSWDSAVAPSVAATGTLTLTGQPLNTETVTLDAKVYTFQTVLTDVDGNVLIGADAEESIENLIAAITLGAGAGTKYAASMTLHSTVLAAKDAGDEMGATAKTRGTAGNSIDTTETMANGAFGAATLENGTQWSATDEGWFDGTVAQSATTGMDQQPVSIAKLTIDPNYTGNIGSSGSPLTFNQITAHINIRGTGTVYLYIDTSSGVMLVDSQNSTNALTVIGGKVKGLLVLRGKVTVASAAVFPEYSICAALGANADIVITGTTTAPSYLQCGAGKIDTGERSAQAAYVTAIEVSGGKLTLKNMTGYDRLIQTGGWVEFDLDDNEGAGLFQLSGGTADFRKCRHAFDTFTKSSYIGPDANIIGGVATTDAMLSASGLTDLRQLYP